jgi:hypothetical protein
MNIARFSHLDQRNRQEIDSWPVVGSRHTRKVAASLNTDRECHRKSSAVLRAPGESAVGGKSRGTSSKVREPPARSCSRVGWVWCVLGKGKMDIINQRSLSNQSSSTHFTNR